MGRQERTASRTRKAASRADAIIAEATQRAQLKRCKCGAKGTTAELKAAGHPRTCATKLAEQEWVAQRTEAIERAKAPQTDAKPRAKVTAGARVVTRPSGHSDEQGDRCVEMREQGASWMAIGAELGLPGAKTGAAAARKLYAAHTGESHRKAPGRIRAVKERHAATTGAKRDRREQVHFGTGLITDDMTDEQVVALLAGKAIEWAIDLRRLADGKGEPEWCEQEARVHPTDLIIEDGKLGERCVRFRTLEGWDEPDRHGVSKPLAGPTRTVRLAAIHTVR